MNDRIRGQFDAEAICTLERACRVGDVFAALFASGFCARSKQEASEGEPPSEASVSESGGRYLGNPLRQFRLIALANLLAQLDQAEQDLVALLRQLVDGARADFGMNAIDQLLLNLRSEVRVA